MAQLSREEIRAAALKAAAISFSVEQRGAYAHPSPSTEDIIERAYEFEQFIRNSKPTRRRYLT